MHVVDRAEAEHLVTHRLAVGEQEELGRAKLATQLPIHRLHMLHGEFGGGLDQPEQAWLQEGFAAGEGEAGATQGTQARYRLFPFVDGEFGTLVEVVLGIKPGAGAEQAGMVAAIGHFQHGGGRKE